MLKSCASSTIKQYEVYLRKWEQFCCTNNLNFSEFNINNYLSFLHSLYQNGLSYVSINCARAALAFAFGMKGEISEDKLICRFMKGISNLRPPHAKYDVTWNVDVVLDYLKGMKIINLSLKFLTIKTVGLLALCTGQRVQTLASIILKDIIFGEQVQIKLTAKLKTTAVHRKNPVLILPKFSDEDLCPVKTLYEYVKVTKGLRNGNEKLFISYVKPYKGVTSQTLSRWLTDLLKSSGIDNTIYTAHSYRHAACSKAADKGVTVDTILQRVGWSDKSKVFAKYYNRPISDRTVFARSILT